MSSSQNGRKARALQKKKERRRERRSMLLIIGVGRRRPQGA